MRLFRVTYKFYDSYVFATTWCYDCPSEWGGDCCKDGDNISTWFEQEDFLELAPSEDVMLSKLKGRRTPDIDFMNVEVHEAPFRMWQQWHRNQSTEPIHVGYDFIPREWLWHLMRTDRIDF